MKTLITVSLTCFLTTITLLLAGCSHGRCIKGDCENGEGTYITVGDDRGYVVTSTIGEDNPAKTTYTGHFKNGKYHGKGTMQWKNDRGEWGNTYEGEWENGKRNGFGIMKWTTGCTYEGQWKDDTMDGQGKYTTDDGKVYKGIFKDNRLDGMRFDRGVPEFIPEPRANKYSI